MNNRYEWLPSDEEIEHATWFKIPAQEVVQILGEKKSRIKKLSEMSFHFIGPTTSIMEEKNRVKKWTVADKYRFIADTVKKTGFSGFPKEIETILSKNHRSIPPKRTRAISLSATEKVVGALPFRSDKEFKDWLREEFGPKKVKISSWDKVSLGLFSRDTLLLEIKVNGKTSQKPFGELDLVDKRNGGPNQEGQLLFVFAGQKGRIPEGDKGKKYETNEFSITINKDTVSLLRRWFEAHFEIKTKNQNEKDPIPYDKGKGWQTRFQIRQKKRPSPSGQRSRELSPEEEIQEVYNEATEKPAKGSFRRPQDGPTQESRAFNHF